MNILYAITTLSFAYPLVLFAPMVYLFIRMVRPSGSEAAAFPKIDALRAISPTLRLRLRRPTLGFLAGLFIVSLALGAARPQKITIVEAPHESRNLMLALDISRSMGTRDFLSGYKKLSRLSAVKQVLAQFITARKHDRLGIVVFGNTAYLQSPLTLDHELLNQLIRQLEVGIAGNGTAIGDGLGLSLKRLQEIAGETKAVILLTDGVSNAGQVNPIKAAKVAKDLGIKVHTIGIGSKDPVKVRVQTGSFSHAIVNRIEFDEKTLKEIASITGGVYFNAEDLKELETVYQEIDRLERSKRDEPAREVVQELFMPYAILALVSYLLYLLLSNSVFMKVP